MICPVFANWLQFLFRFENHLKTGWFRKPATSRLSFNRRSRAPLTLVQMMSAAKKAVRHPLLESNRCLEA